MKDPIGIVGFGNQGQSWALNLKDSGHRVSVFLRPKSPNIKKVKKLKLQHESFQNLSNYKIIALLMPDDAMPSFYQEHGLHIRPGSSLVFAHGFTLHYKTVAWPKDCNHLLLAPKGIGHAVRKLYLEGFGVPCVYNIEHQVNRQAGPIIRQLAKSLGFERAGMYQANVKDEVEADLFSEQVLLCGGVPSLVAMAFDTLVKNGIKPEVAYLECMHELNFMVELFSKQGLFKTLLKASSTAQYGGFMASKKLIDQNTQVKLDTIFKAIRQGQFAKQLFDEAKNHFPNTKRDLEKIKNIALEKTGRVVRSKMKASMSA